MRYFAGECSQREEAEVRALIAVDEEKGRLFDELRKIWDESDDADDDLDTAEAWEKVDRQLRQRANVTSLAASRPPIARRRSTDRSRVPHSALLAAAIVLAIVIGTVVAVDLTFMPDARIQEPDFQVFATRIGERATVRLTDGSRVFLNVDSRLTVPSDFQDGDRTVEFEGQGYFEIAKDSRRPFVVHTEFADIEVLGTEFDVHAYRGSEQVQVVVATGEVSVRSNLQDDTEPIVLKPRDLGLVLQTAGQLVRHDVNVSRYLAWRDGRIIFENASFAEVALQLERHYDLDIRLTPPSNTIEGLTASFMNDPLDEILNVIAIALNLQYTREGKTVTFYPAS